MTEVPIRIDPVYSLGGALERIASHPWQSHVNVADGQPPMPAPWTERMRLQGAMLFIHPARERRVMAYLNRR